MDFTFECQLKFNNALTEVDALVNQATDNTNNNLTYRALIKGALIFLLTKFEVFLEEVIDEYIDYINSLDLTSEKVPIVLRINHCLNILQQYRPVIENNINTEKIEKVYLLLSKPWIGTAILNELNINCKFNYGKHGETEVIRLFKKIGFDDIFDKITIYEESESLLEEEKVKIDFKGIFNSLVNQRNNIVHQDATPNLTERDLRKFKNYIINFNKELIQRLQLDLLHLHKLKIKDDEKLKAACGLN